MITIPQIKALFVWAEDTYHAQRIKEQKIDDLYYRDEFDVPHIKAPYTVIKQGTGRELVDVPASHIVTAHPQVYVEATDSTDTARDRAKKRGSLLNHWVDFIGRQNPNPFQEGIKKLLRRGEQWIHIVNNSDFSKPFEDDIPITFAVPDPLVIFASPDERNGIPDYVIVSYKRYWKTVLNKYEHWGNPKHRGLKGNDTDVEWFEYWDKDIRYFEADGEPVLPLIGHKGCGIQPNILGVVPFVHCYSGYGDKTATGAPEDLAVSRIRPHRGKLLEETEVASYIASQLKLHAVGRVDILTKNTEADALAQKLQYDLSVGSVNIVQSYAYDIDEHMGAEPGPAVFAHLAQIKADIQRINPPIMSGIGTGSSGRQEDIYTKHALAQYESVINNSATAWAIALGLGLRIIKNKYFGILPIDIRATLIKDGKQIRALTTVKEEDIDDFTCTLKLKAADPIEDKAQSSIGANLQGQGIVDWETNLTRYQGFSLDEAKEIQNKVMVDRLLQIPEVFAAMAQEALAELGITPPIALGQPPTGPVPGQPGSQGGPPRKGNIKDVDVMATVGADMLAAPRPPRAPPGQGR